MDKKIMHIVIAKTWGGGEQYVYDICKELLRRGIKAYVVVDITNIAMQKKFSEVAEVVSVNLYFFAGLLSIKKLVILIKHNNIGFINCHSGHAMLLCLMLKRLTDSKLIMFKHNAIPAKYDFYHKWQRKSTDAFVCVSKLVYDLQIKNLSSEEKRKFSLIYNGIDTEKFNKNIHDLKNSNIYNIGYAGRIAENKGIDILIDAFSLLSDKYNNVQLLLAGADEKNYLKNIENIIYKKRLNDKIQYLGKLNDMETFYKKLNVFVLPSVVKEAFGLVICEAIYCGIPVITTDSGAQKEIIKDQSFGMIIKKNNIKELFQALDDCYTQNIKFSKDGNKYIEQNFSIKSCVDNIISLYKNI